MKTAFFYGAALLVLAAAHVAGYPRESGQRGPPTGDYLGQEPPGRTPEVFAPGVVSTGMDELNSVFSPDGTTFLFAVKMPGRARHTLLAMARVGDDWTMPEVLPFSGVYGDADPTFDESGDRIFFISTRPVLPGGEPKKDWDIWVVDRTDGGWGEPRNLGAPVNTDRLEVYPSVTDDGTLYFSSGRDGGLGKNDIYRSRPVEDGYGSPENLGDAINSEDGEGDLYVAPDESYIIFVSSGRSDGRGDGDLYISFRNDEHGWTEAVNMGDEINTRYLEYCPVVTSDGKYLFFTSYRRVARDDTGQPLVYDEIQRAYRTPQTGLGDIYWMDAGVIDQLRNRLQK